MRTTFEISARIRSDVKISRQFFTYFLFEQSESKCMLPRLAESVIVGQNLSSNPEAWGVDVTLKCGTGEQRVQTLDVVLLCLAREAVVLVQKVW